MTMGSKCIDDPTIHSHELVIQQTGGTRFVYKKCKHCSYQLRHPPGNLDLIEVMNLGVPNKPIVDTEFHLFFVRLMDSCRNPLEKQTLRHSIVGIQDSWINQCKENY